MALLDSLKITTGTTQGLFAGTSRHITKIYLKL